MLEGWILSLMLLLEPQTPWRDTYAETANAIDQAVQEMPPAFSGELAVEKTAALLVALAWAESTFKPNAVGARGKVRGLYQIGGKGNLSDPIQASRVALELVNESFQVCRARPVAERLAFYAGGTCSHPTAEALNKSRFRVMKALWLVKHHPPPAAAP